MNHMEQRRRITETANHIRLIPATAEHAPVLFAIFNGVNTAKYSPVSKTSVEELAVRLGESGGNFTEQARFYRFFGEYHSTIFGTFIVKSIDWHKQEAEIGFSLLDAWQGQGLGSALVYSCVSKMFAESTFEQLWATVSVTNVACQRLMRSLGFSEYGLYKEPFHIKGTFVDQTLYRIRREQWNAARRCPKTIASIPDHL